MIEFAPEPGGREPLAAFLQSLRWADWESTTGPIRLSADLTLADLAEAAFFHNTRLLLATLAAEEGTAATATGSLNRVFVRELFDQLTLPEPFRFLTQRGCKVINERDVWPLHLVRVVSQCAGFVGLRKQRFHITRAGRALLPEGQAGALFRRLFLAYFRKFNLHYDFCLRDVPGIQSTMAAILWRLDTVVRDWTPVRGLAPQILLPAIIRQLVAATVPVPHQGVDPGRLRFGTPYRSWADPTAAQRRLMTELNAVISRSVLVAKVHQFSHWTRRRAMKPWPIVQLGEVLRHSVGVRQPLPFPAH